MAQWSERALRPAPRHRIAGHFAVRGRRFLVRPFSPVAAAFEAERARWFLWLPVMLGIGIGLYFACPREPGGGETLSLVLAAAAIRVSLSLRQTGFARAVATALLAVVFGFVLAKMRAGVAAAPVLERTYRGLSIEGIVELAEPRTPSGQRLTLRVTHLDRIAREKWPERVRVRTAQSLEGLGTGDRVRVRAVLSPPFAPALPGDYDFARRAFFEGIGGIGFSIRAAEKVVPAAGDSDERAIWLHFEELRRNIDQRIAAALPGEAGAIASALITGERGRITEETTAAFRDSGLIHVLSISGLHMVVMAGAVYAGVRMALALVPALALRYPIKKWAAAAALAAGLGYLAISGWSVATVRAFLMIAIMLMAVMLDRPALAMRNVALAALAVLLWRPESLLDPGFQMSFAAVVSLIAAYEVVRGEDERRAEPRLFGRIAFFFGGILLSTLVAGIAVAPFSAYHFHKSQQYALLANLAAIPVCNMVVMPMALLTLIAMPFGLEAAPLAVMGWGIGVMHQAAEFVARLPGAVLSLPAFPGHAFGLIVAGGLWLALWRRRWRHLGLVLVAAGLAAAPHVVRPDVLVSRDGSLVAVRGADGRLAARGTAGTRFELQRWLEHDGDGRTPAEALKAPGPRCDRLGCMALVEGVRVAWSKGAGSLDEDCRRADLLVTAGPLPADCPAPRLRIGRNELAAGGAHAIGIGRDGSLAVMTVAASRGARPWSRPPEAPVATTTAPEKRPSDPRAGLQ